MLTALSGESCGGGPVRKQCWAYIGNLMLALLVSTPVFAQTAPKTAPASSAHERLDAGELAFAQGRFADALDAFEASYRKRREPQTLRRIGDAADKLGSHARAAEAWQAYLKHVPDAADREYIASRIDANHAALGPTHPSTVNIEIAPMTVSSDQQPGHNASDSAPTLAVTHTGETSQPRSERTNEQPAGPIWLWAAGGAVVVAGIIIAAVVIGAGGSPSTSDPVQGNVGSAIQTLGSR